MSYLIFSDTHGASQNMTDVIERCHSNTEGVIFLGDVCSDTELVRERFPNMPIYAVAGNCEVSVKYLTPEYAERMLEIEGFRILILHGHTRSVKFHLGELEAYARRADADAVLFGHTHERCCKYTNTNGKPLYIFNPGSAGLPKDGLPPSFGVLSIGNGQILLSHGDVHVTRGGRS